MNELQERAASAFAARQRREGQDRAAQDRAALQARRERGGEALYTALEIRTEPGAWQLDPERNLATIEQDGLRFGYLDGATMGPKLYAQRRCNRCDAWYNATAITGTAYPPIEQLGRHLAELEEDEPDHPYCPADERCWDEDCPRAEPHYGHRPGEQDTAAQLPDAPAPAAPERSPDEKLGDALRAWLQANAVTQAHAIGAALHDEIEAAVKAGPDG